MSRIQTAFSLSEKPIQFSVYCSPQSHMNFPHAGPLIPTVAFFVFWLVAFFLPAEKLAGPYPLCFMPVHISVCMHE